MLAAAAVEGEWGVAHVRLVAMALLLISPTIKLINDPANPIYIWGFVITLVAALAAVAIWLVLRLRGWHRWLGFFSSSLDVSLVTTALAIFVVVGSPLTALNSKVTFEIYFLAIAATSLRYDARICLTVGLLALLQYGMLWAGTAWRYDLSDPAFAVDSGGYSAIDQVTRLILLLVSVLLALTVVRRAQSLLYLTSRDRLTGLWNRGQFDRTLTLEIDRARRYQHPLTLAMIDVDRFKQINDEYGHPVGDRVLRALAERLSTGLRRTDVVARYGGEEFAVLMAETAPEPALERIESLRREIAAAPIDIGDGRTITLDFSAGIAMLEDGATNRAATLLVERADARLREAKRAGRGRTLGEVD